MNLPDLHLLRPWWLLALLPLALLIWRLARRGGGAAAWRGLVDPHLLPHLLETGAGTRSRLPLILLVSGAILAVLALAGPAWERLPQPVFQTERYQVLALDISPTMNAPDVAPSRLAQARFEVLDLLKRSEGQVALIAYGAEPYVVSPLSADADTIALQVPELSSDLLPVDGKNAAAALDKAHELLRRAAARDGEVILISDGLRDPAAAREAAERLRTDGHRVSVLAVGTEQGAPVPRADGGFLQDANGAILLPRLDGEALNLLADSGGGRYVRSRPDDLDLDVLAPTGSQRAAAEENEAARSDQWREEGPWLLLALLPLAALAFRRGWLSPLLLVLLIAPPEPARAFDWKDLWLTPDQQGQEALRREQPQKAAELFEQPDWRAAARYQAGDYENALNLLEQSDDARAHYNRGNTLARLGRLQEAIDAYDQSLALDPEDADAAHNRALLESLLQQQQQQQNPSQNGEQGGGQQSTQQDSGQSAGDGAEQQSGEQSGDGQQSADTASSDGEQDQEQPKSDDNASQAPNPEGGETPEETQSAQSGGGNEANDTQVQAPASARPDATEDDNRQPGLSDLTAENAKPPEQPAQAVASPPRERGPIPESAQAAEQWLRRVPDDPGGLLRQRFLLQHLRNTGRLPE